MKKIAVLTDSSSGYTFNQAKQHHIYMLSLQIIIDNETYEDGIDLTSQDLIVKLNENKRIRTSTPTLANMLKMFQTIKADGYDHVLAIPLSASLSSTACYLKQAALEVGIDIDIIEIYSTMFIQQHVVKLVQQCVNRNMEIVDILAFVKPIIANARTLILPSDLHYLKAGGRLTPAAAALATVLKIRPILALDQNTKGKVDVIDKVRTDKKAIHTMVNRVKKMIKHKNVHVYIGHSDAFEKALYVNELLMKEGVNQDDITITDLVAVIMSHTGKGCVGIQVIEK